MRKSNIVPVLMIVVVLGAMNGCATTAAQKSSGVTTSREATDIWHSYQILPNYNYYYAGPDSRPNYIIGIDDKYTLASKLWKPVDLTPEMLNNWFNYVRPRVGYSQDPYGAYISDAGGERIGLWYSVNDWRLTGTAVVSADDRVDVTIPTKPTGRQRRPSSCKF